VRKPKGGFAGQRNCPRFAIAGQAARDSTTSHVADARAAEFS